MALCKRGRSIVFAIALSIVGIITVIAGILMIVGKASRDVYTHWGEILSIPGIALACLPIIAGLILVSFQIKRAIFENWWRS